LKAYFSLNRPIHLARRDAYFETAVELLYMPVQEMDTSSRLQHVERVLSLMKTAETHAFFAIRSSQAMRQEHDFLHFLKLIAHNIQSALSMTQHQSHLEAEESFLCQFLSTKREECVLPAMHYRRRADDILQGLWHLLRLAHKPYRELQQANLGAMSEEEQARYKKAYQSFREELSRKNGARNHEAPVPADAAAKV
jgi:hypothetical protein